MPTWAMVLIIVGLLALAVVRSIDWKGKAIKWVGNNPDRGQVYVKAGHDLKTYPAKRTYISTKGQIYEYETEAGKLRVMVPGPGTKKKPQTEYPYEYIRGRRVIGIEDGLLVASPLGFMDPTDKKMYRESVTDVSAILEGAVFTNTVRSIKRTAQKAINWILIILAVGAAGYFIYTNYIAPDTADVPAETPPVEQEIPDDLRDEQTVPLRYDNSAWGSEADYVR